MSNGSFLPLDADGYFVNPTAEAYLQAPWTTLVSRSVFVLQERFHHVLHSVYIRGSVPAGTAIVGISDVDIIALLNDAITDADHTWRRTLEANSREDDMMLAEIELDLVPLAQVMTGEDVVLWRFVLATQSLCVRGPSILSALPKVRPSRELALALCAGTRRHVERTIAQLQQEQPSGVVTRVCRRSAKYLLRAAAALFLESDGYTRDLGTAAVLLARRYPERSADIWQAVDMALRPQASASTVASFVNSLGTWVATLVDAAQHDGRT